MSLTGSYRWVVIGSSRLIGQPSQQRERLVEVRLSGDLQTRKR
jgi:hypothetical protein